MPWFLLLQYLQGVLCGVFPECFWPCRLPLFTAILKVIFDRIEPLKPWGFLLGDVMPPIGKSIFNFRKEESRK